MAPSSGFWKKLPHYLLDLRKTRRTVGMLERKLVRTYAMGLAIRPLTYPAFETRGSSRLILHESAGTTGT